MVAVGSETKTENKLKPTASFPAPQEVARLTQQLTGAQTVQEEQEKAKAVELQEQLSSKQHNGWNEADPNIQFIFPLTCKRNMLVPWTLDECVTFLVCLAKSWT